jgi:signal transduction histidine kinase
MDVTRPSGVGRDESVWVWAASGVAVVVGAVGVLGTDGLEAKIEVVVLTLVTIAGFLAKARWPRLPTAALVVWTFAPAVVLNVQERGEGTMFLLVVAVSFVTYVEPDGRVRAAAGSLAVLLPLLIELVAPHDWGWPFWMLGVGFGWLAGEQLRRYRRLLAELEVTRELLADRAVDAERRRIAAELHDLVGHSLSVVLLHVTAARRRLAADAAGAAEALEQAETVGRNSLADIRRSVRLLRSERGSGIAPTPSAVEVPALVDEVRSAGMHVELDASADLGVVDPVGGLAIYRIVQESLVNATRHAPGSSVHVVVTVGAREVEVEVVDRGGRTTPSGAPGVGLTNMRERVDVLGGTLQTGPVRDGWRVHARIPRPAPIERHAGGSR